MEENVQLQEGEIVGIRFSLATHEEVCTASINNCSICHSTQLTNPFLGLPLEFGKCESCGTSEPGQCEGLSVVKRDFLLVELLDQQYKEARYLTHLSGMSEKKMGQLQMKNVGMAEWIFACCEESSQVSIKEVKKADGVCFLELKLPPRAKIRWNFLEQYGFRYGDDNTRLLLPVEVSKHSSFQDSRCFYVVSTDGQRQDFSYRKCLESFIKGKYPDLSEEFVGKYFARTRGNRQRNPVPEYTRDGTLQPTLVQESAGDGNGSGDGILPTPLSTATQ